jgi:uncharacterized protein YjbI with pentapeptide repeats
MLMTLLHCLSMCVALESEERARIQIDWRDHLGFGNLLHRIRKNNDRVLPALRIFARVDAAGAYLLAQDLIGAELGAANLEGAFLRGANLGGAYLRGAHLRYANLEGANLTGANLEGANLESAHLEDTRLKGANLGRTILEGENLAGAKRLVAARGRRPR